MSNGPSSRPGMGSIPYDGGTTFRVWAPFGQNVHVVGTFNNWSISADLLANEGNGYWSVDVAGAKAGDEYKYMIEYGGARLDPWRADPYAQAMKNSPHGNSIVHDSTFSWSSTAFRMPDWDELVIYELHVGTFNDTRPDGPGMFETVIERLPEVADLGVSAIQLLPPAEYPGYSSQGYNPAAIFAVETDFGGPDALKQLIEAAHGYNLAVLCDVVYNHVDLRNNILRVFDGWQDDSHPDGIYFYEYGRINTPFGGPRPDYGRGEVRQFLRDNALMWLEDYRFDGLRWDATNYIRTVDGGPGWDIPDGRELMRWVNDEINRRQPWKISIAEDMQDYNQITQTTAEGGAGFDSQWASHFYKTVRSELTQAWDQDRSMPAIRDAIQYRYNANALSRVIYTESHDEVSFSNGKRRLPTDITPEDPQGWYAKKRSTLGAALVFTSPGIPMIFQGQEFLDEAQWVDNVPLDWTKRDARAGIVSLYRDLIALRRNRHYTTRGLRGQNVNVHHVNEDDKLIAFHRYASGGPRDDVIVVLNMANRSYEHYTLGVPRAGWWRVRFNSDWIGYDPGFGEQPTFDAMARPATIDGMAFAVDIGIGRYSSVILSQDD